MNETTGTTTAPGGSGTHPPDPAPDPHAGPRTEWNQVKDVGGLQRPTDRMIAGVAAGLARHFNIDPLVVRVAFVVFSLIGGSGVVVYGALWLLLPEDGKAQAAVHLDERSRGVALIGVLSLAALALIGDTWGLYRFPWPLAVLAVAVWFLWSRRRAFASAQTATSTSPATAGTPASTTDPNDPAGPTAAPAAPAHYAQPYVQPTLPTRPRDPRRRGPALFWFTLALIALSMGVLGTVDLAGVSVVDSAYPALALAISGAMLLLGAFWGRAGGIIFIALVAAFSTAAAMGGETWSQSSDRRFTPESVSEVRDSYELRRGQLVLDLTDISDPQALAGRKISIDAGVGRIEVRLPEGLDYEIEAAVGVGSIRLPSGGDQGGLGVSSSARSDEGDESSRLRITTDMGVGEIVVEQP